MARARSGVRALYLRELPSRVLGIPARHWIRPSAPIGFWLRLDSSTAEAVMATLKALSGHRLVICTVHQPSSRMFGTFDKLMLMAQGSVVYYGLASQAVAYFSGYDPTVARAHERASAPQNVVPLSRPLQPPREPVVVSSVPMGQRMSLVGARKCPMSRLLGTERGIPRVAFAVDQGARA